MRALPLAASVAVAGLFAASAVSASAAPIAAPGYSVSVFAPTLAGTSGADSVEVIGGNVYVGYSNRTPKDGSGGPTATSTIAEYSAAGLLLGTTSVIGHNDGLRYNAATGQIWSMQNEDGNPNLVLITPGTLAKSAIYTVASVNNGGGFDDIAFTGGKAFITASNPANSPNSDPALVTATLGAGVVNIVPVLQGDATVTPLNASAPTTLNLQDPDSLSFTQDGKLVLDSQGDGLLLFITNPGTPTQSVEALQLLGNIQVDDTEFAGAFDKTLLVADKGTSIIYAVTGPFGFNTGYSAGQDTTPGLAGPIGFIGALNADGSYDPIVTGLSNPGGEAFLVPEPASLAMFGTGVLGLAGIRRRKV